MEINFSDLKKKKVVNVLDGKILGHVTDLVMELPEGKVTAFICGESCRLFGREEYIVKLCCINKIGDDAVVVSLKTSE